MPTPLYRVIPPQNIFPKKSDNYVKSLKSVRGPASNKVITLIDTDLNGVANYGYYMTIGVGNPPQQFNFVIDTGSSNTAVAGAPLQFVDKYFKTDQSSTFVNQKIAFNVMYDSGKWSGIYSSDVFTFNGVAYVDTNRSLKYSNPVSVISNFAVIYQHQTFFLKNANWQGILGLAYAILAKPNDVVQKSTIFDDIVKSYGLPNMFSVVLCGHNKADSKPLTSGYFIAGGKNESLYDPPMVDILIYRKWFYEIIISRISISNKPIIISSCKEYNRDKTILDTGTTDTYLPSMIFHSLVSSIIFNMNKTPFYMSKDSPFWERRAVICILSSSPRHPSIYFPEVNFELVINDTSSLEIALSPQQYIQYVGDQTDNFGNTRNCFKFGFAQSKAGTILGDSFLEGFYILFNKETSKVGFAQSKCNVHSPGIPRSRIIKVNRGQQGLLACAVSNLASRSFLDQLTPTITIIIGILFGLILLPSLIILIYFRCNELKDPETSNLIDPSTRSLYETIK